MKVNHFLMAGIIVVLGMLSYTAYREGQYDKFVFENGQSDLSRIEKRLNTLSMSIKTIEVALGGKNETLTKALDSERAARRLFEAQSQLGNLSTQVKLTELTQNLERTKSQSASEIVETWRPRLALVSCNFGPLTKRGSGVLFFALQADGSRAPRVITNRHLVANSAGLGATSCTSVFPDGSVLVSRIDRGEIEVSAQGLDFGYLAVRNISNNLNALAAQPAHVCISSAVKTGDGVIILGYPVIGAGRELTATEGIVSGREENYFITSAKVETGNSGGAAILTKSNCYLGIPTFVELGALESLARILDASLMAL